MIRTSTGHTHYRPAVILILILVLTGCNTEPPAAQPVAPDTTTTAIPGGTTDTAGQPVRITGTFDYTNDIITEYYVQHQVMLADMYGFVIRDQEWETPIDSQVIGFLDIDEAARRGSYQLQLPAAPAGTFADVDNDNQSDQGVQIFAVSYAPNLTGGPFAVDDDPNRGWPIYLASIRTDRENGDEVIGGKLIVWTPDAEQQFPTDFGPDALLFTADDPVAGLPAGYSIIDLDQSPFALQHTPVPELTLYEPTDVVVKDFSDLNYADAFAQMFEQVRREYAFNGIPNKTPDWDALYAELAPRIAAADKQNDAQAFYLALNDFVFAFRDGHVNLNGGAVGDRTTRAALAGGYGLAIRELDDGRVIVVYIRDSGPADRAGIRVGAEITTFDGMPIGTAIDNVQPLSGPFSTEFARRYEQTRYLLRAPVGTETAITFTNPGQRPRTATLTTASGQQSFNVTSLFADYDPYALPVEYELLPSDIGYIRVNSNFDDLNLIIRLFERALATFDQIGVPGIIIDMRLNLGGAPLGLAGFLTDETIPLGQLEYYSEATGTFEPDGPPDEVFPNENQYRFDRMALLVDQSCYSACELEAYAFSQVPGMIIVGQYPTAGVEAEVARGQFRLPESITLQVPTGRFTRPDGSIFLEGIGVEPTLRLPITEETVLSNEDPVLQAAEAAILE